MIHPQLENKVVLITGANHGIGFMVVGFMPRADSSAYRPKALWVMILPIARWVI